MRYEVHRDAPHQPDGERANRATGDYNAHAKRFVSYLVGDLCVLDLGVSCLRFEEVCI